MKLQIWFNGEINDYVVCLRRNSGAAVGWGLMREAERQLCDADSTHEVFLVSREKFLKLLRLKKGEQNGSASD